VRGLLEHYTLLSQTWHEAMTEEAPRTQQEIYDMQFALENLRPLFCHGAKREFTRRKVGRFENIPNEPSPPSISRRHESLHNDGDYS
jgi:hypothetical protein